MLAALTLVCLVTVSYSLRSDTICKTDPSTGLDGCSHVNSPVSHCCGSLTYKGLKTDSLCIPSVYDGYTSATLNFNCASKPISDSLCLTDSDCGSGHCYRSSVSLTLVTDSGANVNVENIKEAGKCVQMAP